MRHSDNLIIVIGGSGRIGKVFCSLIDSKEKYGIINIDPKSKTLNIPNNDKYINIEYKLDSLESAEKILNHINKKFDQFNVKGIVNLSRTSVSEDFLIESSEIINSINAQIKGLNCLLHLMIEKKILKDCSIVHMGSLNAHLVSHQPVFYHYLKVAIESASRAIAYKLAPFNVRSNVVIAGLVSDPSFKLNERQIKIQERSIPLKSGPPSINDICNLIYFLVTNKSKSITGTSIVIDSGMSLPDSYNLLSKFIE